MRVFVAGSTGAIGIPLVKALTAYDHDVIGLTRSADGARMLTALGAEPVVADAFDIDAMCSILRDSRPDVVVEQMTALPKVNTPENRRLAAPLHMRTRIKAGANLQTAAHKAGVRRYVAQSSAFWAAPGPGLADESDSLAVRGASVGVTSGAQTLATLERRVLGAMDLEGVVLRYGFFYGPRTWYSAEGSATAQARACKFPVIGNGTGIWSFVHIEDAAKATVTAVEQGTRGIYHIVDDEPSPLSTWLPAFCRHFGAPPPPRLSIAHARHQFGEDAIYYATQLRGASNAKAKRELAFRPRPLEWMHSS